MSSFCKSAPSRPDSRPPSSRLPPDSSTPLLAAWLGARLKTHVRLSWSRAQRTLFTYERSPAGIMLRLHPLFHCMGEDELEALARVLEARDRRAMRLLRLFFARHAPLARTQTQTPSGPAKSRGQVYDLQELFDEQNRLYFSNRSQATIVWGRNAARRGRQARHSMQLGCYVPDLRLVRIHPRLDDTFVPRYFIGFVIFHELLHEVFGVEDGFKNRRVHPPEFKVVEQGHPDYARSIRWERANLARLLAG